MNGMKGCINKLPPNRPDLTRINVFVWDTLGDRVNANIIENKEYLKEHIRRKIHILNENYIHSTTATIERLRRTFGKGNGENGS